MRITANQVSFSRILFLPIPCVLLYGGPGSQFAAVLLFIALGITDYVDGYLARRYGSTEFGKFLDPVSDKIFITALFLPLLDLKYFPVWPVVLLFCREFLVTDLRSIYNMTGASFTTSRIAKLKTNVQVFGAVIAILLVLAEGTLLMHLALGAVVVGLLVWTVIAIVRKGKAHFYLASALVLFVVAFLTRAFGTVWSTNYLMAVVVMGFTVYSGGEYFWGGRAELRRYVAADPFRRSSMLLVNGVAVPTLFVLIAALGIGPAWVPITILSLEFVSGGVDNFLSMHKIDYSWWWKSIKLVGQLSTGLIALIACLGTGDACGLSWMLYISLALTLVYTLIYTARHTKRLVAGSKATG